MASLIIYSIRSVLDDLALLKVRRRFLITDELEFFLKSLRTFSLCAKKFGEDAQLMIFDHDNINLNMEPNLGSLLLRIGEVIGRNALKIQPLSRGLEDGSYALEHPDGVDVNMSRVLRDFREDIVSFEKGIDQWYTTLSDSLHLLPKSRSPTTNEVMEIIDSFLGNLDYLKSFTDHLIGDAIEAMGEKTKLFRNFILFVAMQSSADHHHEQLGNFVIHAASIAISAAQLTAPHSRWKHWSIPENWESRLLALLQKIKPINPRVLEAYKTALASSKSSKELHYSRTLDLDHDPFVIMRDFVDFLSWSLWETQQMDSCLAVSMKDQLQLLWEGLRFLRTILNEQPNQFDETVRYLFRVVICDAGVIIFSLYQKDAEMDLGLVDLLAKFKMIRAEVEEQAPETSMLNLSKKTSVLGFLNCLLESLMEVKSSKVDYDSQSRIESILEDLVYLRSVLEVLVQLQNQQGDLETLWNRAVMVASSLKFLIDQLVLGDIPDSLSFDTITEDIRIFKTDALNIFHGGRQEIEVNKVTRTSTQVPPQSSAPGTDEVVGFKDETASIIYRLTRGSKKLQVIGIVGMPGLGKTTLATKVYNDPTVMHHFHVHAWCSVSQVYNPKRLLLKLLNHIVTELPDSYQMLCENDLAQKLWRSLKQRRYLIFLDDLWDIEVWDNLSRSLPDDSNGSRILLTSRRSDVVPQPMLDEEPHLLRHLTKDESWELLLKKIFLRNDIPDVLYELGKQISDSCKGLPLTVVVVAGLLTSLEPDIWKQVLESLSSGIISSTEQCIKTLDVSYIHLPHYLRPCFLYFGLFPEDQEVSCKQLIWLWIAEGFVYENKTKLKSLEDVATNYLMDLINRSLVIVSKKGSIGGVKACRIHDLLRDFCITKAKEENFFLLLKRYDEILAFNELCYLPRLCIHSEKRDFMKLRLFHPRIHSLLFSVTHNDPPFFTHNNGWDKIVGDISFITLIFRHLRVLDIRQIDMINFPSGMKFLVQLRYLAITVQLGDIPSTIGNLSNMETLIVDSFNIIKMPYTIWDLHKLRHLCISRAFHFSTEDLDNSSGLHELESCSIAIISSWDNCEKLMRKFPKIKKLKCRVFKHWDNENCNKILIPDSLGPLKSLEVSSFGGVWDSYFMGSGVPKQVQFEFNLPPNLIKLTLNSFKLPRSEISTIGNLPNLEVLKLLEVQFCGGIFDMAEEEFSKLKFLKLTWSNIVRWTASDDQLPYLQKLKLSSCESLEEIPSCLKNISTLETIEVSDCSQYVESFIKEIQDVHIDMGNTALKILITQSSAESHHHEMDSSEQSSLVISL